MIKSVDGFVSTSIVAVIFFQGISVMVLQTSFCFCYDFFSLEVFAKHETVTSAYLIYASTALFSGMHGVFASSRCLHHASMNKLN